MTVTLKSLWGIIRQFASTPLGHVAIFAGVYLLLQLVILPKMGVQT